MDGRTDDQLLVTKLQPPSVPAAAIDRSRLTRRVALPDRPVTVVVAPAGFGKSTLLAQWSADATGAVPVAFAGLDASDDDPAAFWATLLSGLRRAGCEMSGRVPKSPQVAGAGIWRTLVPSVINDLAGGGPGVLLIDDYHHVSDKSIHTGVRFLLDNVPSGIRIVVASRREPPLGLARLRASGRLEEIRAADLALDISECAALVEAASGVSLRQSDAESLQRRTEGWPAGLQLAALSLRGHDDPAGFIRGFAGDHRHVADYLTSEVVGQLSADLRLFLLRCSVLGRLSPALCNAVTGGQDAANLLVEAEEAGLFLVPLDMQRRWFRLHRLFADWLLHRLEVEAPDEVAVLHRRAAAWYLDQGMIDDAIEHLLSGGQWSDAGRLIVAEAGRLTEKGRSVTLGRWLAALPDQVVTSDPALAIAGASLSSVTGDLERAERLVAAAEEAAAAGEPSEIPIDLDVEVAAARATILLVRRDLEGAALMGRRAAQLERDPSRERYGIGHVLSATALLWLDRCGEARRTLDEVWSEIDTVFVRTMAAGVLATACVETGDLERAERVARHAIEISEAHHTGPSPEMVLVHLALGSVCTQRGDTEAADAYLAAGIELAQWWAAPAQVAYGRLLQARLRARQGDRDGGLRLLREAAPTVESARNRGLLAAALRRAERALRRPHAGSSRGPTVELTERELDVLRLLPSHLSARDIGHELGVSLNTIKTHIRNLYLKLGVSSRADAVDRARELYLL